MIDKLTNKRVVFLTGKGGTGKSSVAVALALYMRSLNRRVLLVETGDSRPAMERYFSAKVEMKPRRASDGIWVSNVDFLGAMEAYIRELIPVGKIVSAILSNRVVRYFLDATPGARELVMLSRILQLDAMKEQGKPMFDLIVVDLPASGHAVNMFGTLRVIQKVFQAGPLRARGEELIERFSDNDYSGVFVVAIPEEMSINETLETAQKFTELKMPPLLGILLNRFPDVAFPDRVGEVIEELDESELKGVTGLMIEAGAVSFRAQRRAEDGLVQLREADLGPVVALPRVLGEALEVSEQLAREFAEMNA